MPNVELSWKAQSIAALRQLIVALVTGVIITAALVIGFSGQTANEREVREQTLKATLATACVLSLPVDETGRDEDEVAACFTQYGLAAPGRPGG